jgi:hypothetical protein
MIDLPAGLLMGWLRIGEPGVTGAITRTGFNGIVQVCEDCTAVSCIEIPPGEVVNLPSASFSAVRLDQILAIPSLNITILPPPR